MRLKNNVIVHSVSSNDIFSHGNGVVEVWDEQTPDIRSPDVNGIWSCVHACLCNVCSML